MENKSMRYTKDWLLSALWLMWGYKIVKFQGSEGMPNWATVTDANLNKLMRDVELGKIDINMRDFRVACRKVKSIELSELK